MPAHGALHRLRFLLRDGAKKGLRDALQALKKVKEDARTRPEPDEAHMFAVKGKWRHISAHEVPASS